MRDEDIEEPDAAMAERDSEIAAAARDWADARRVDKPGFSKEAIREANQTLLAVVLGVGVETTQAFAESVPESAPISPVEKVVTPIELEAVTMDGWQVIESLSFDGTFQWIEQVPVDHGTYRTMDSVGRTQVGRQVAFRVRKVGSARLAELQGKLSGLQGLLSANEREVSDAREKLEKETNAHETTKAKLQEAVTLAARIQTELKEVKDTILHLSAANESLDKELKDFERVKRVFGLRAVSEALMKSDAVDVLKDSSPEETKP